MRLGEKTDPTRILINHRFIYIVRALILVILWVGGNGYLTFLTFQSSGSGALGDPFPPPREPPGDPGGQEIAKIAKNHYFVKLMEIP